MLKSWELAWDEARAFGQDFMDKICINIHTHKNIIIEATNVVALHTANGPGMSAYMGICSLLLPSKGIPQLYEFCVYTPPNMLNCVSLKVPF